MDATVLLIDDDDKLRELLREYLGGFGYRVEEEPDGRSASVAVERHKPDVVILDVMLPGPDGFEVLKSLRAASEVPVIMLTARGEDTDRIVGLEMGADDYLSKPFNPRELLARIKAVLRRVRAAAESSVAAALDEEPSAVVEVAGLRLDRLRRVLRVDGEELELGGAEAMLLAVLMERPNRVLSRDELMNLTRGRDFMAFERSIDVHVSKIRSRLERFERHRGRIKTVWGAGYMFVE